MNDVFIVEAKRTPFGKFGGGLTSLTALELGVHLGQAVVGKALPGRIDQVIIGQVLQAGQGMNIARQLSLALGIPHQAPAFTVNMVCGSSLKAVALAREAIALGDADLILAGGIEMMSHAPYYQRDIRWGKKLGNVTAQDAILVDGLTDPTLNIAMGETAERIAEKFTISREEQDAFAATSQSRVAANVETIRREIVPAGSLTDDEHPRPGTTIEELSKLKPAFRKDGSVTAGNASGINDGASLVLLAGKKAIEQYNLKARARVVAGASVGCEPALMGLGPVNAIKKVYNDSGWELDPDDAIEINEAFAAQVLGCARQLGIDVARINQRGGAIAIGHPIGASGARVLTTLLHQMEDRQQKRGVASLCIGGGMGIAMTLELLSDATK